MGFSENTKLKVREMAGFQCCYCQKVGVEIHHILPQKDDGLDDIDNAAPLCPNCHADFGNNPDKRKTIKQMRDWLYGKVERKYGQENVPAILQDISISLKAIQQGDLDVSGLKELLSRFNEQAINELTPDTAVEAASEIIGATSASDFRPIAGRYIRWWKEHKVHGNHRIFATANIKFQRSNKLTIEVQTLIDYSKTSPNYGSDYTTDRIQIWKGKVLMDSATSGSVVWEQTNPLNGNSGFKRIVINTDPDRIELVGEEEHGFGVERFTERG